MPEPTPPRGGPPARGSAPQEGKQDSISEVFATNNEKPPLAEVGSSGLKRYGGQIQEEFLTQLRGLQGVRVYDEMRKNDPTVGGMIRATKDAMLSVTWDVVSKGDTPADKEAAEFLETCMDDMSVSWKDMISEATTMVPFGWAYMEVVYKKRQGFDPKDPTPKEQEGSDPSPLSLDSPLPINVSIPTVSSIAQSGKQPEIPIDPAKSKYDDNRIGWRKIVLRGQETLYRWDIDLHGGIRAMEQFDPVVGGGIRRIEIERALLFRTDREKNNPEGLSFLRWVYPAWYKKKQIEEVEAIGIERDLTGLPVFTLPQGATTQMQQRALDMLRKLKMDESAGLALERGPSPDGRQDWLFELVASPGGHAIDTNAVINRYAAEIALGFLANFLRLGSDSSSGSYALSREQKDFYYLTITGLLDNIEETINRFLVRKLFEYNAFPKLEQLPEIKHGKVGQREMAAFIQAVVSLSDSGLIGPVDSDLMQFLRETLDLPEIKQEQVDAIDAQEKAKSEAAAEDPLGLAMEATKAEMAATSGGIIDPNKPPMPGQRPPARGAPPTAPRKAASAGGRPGARPAAAKPASKPAPKADLPAKKLSAAEIQVGMYLDGD